MQDFELWWLLIFPVFFGLGWLAARVDMREVLGQGSMCRSLLLYRPAKPWWMTKPTAPPRAGRGGAPPAARRRAASGAGAAVSQTRRARPGHPPADRLLQDHADDLTPRNATLPALSWRRTLRAGLVDRAEEILVKLGQGALAHEARKCLLEIYQQEQNWRALSNWRAS